MTSVRSTQIREGSLRPLGASRDGEGTNCAVFSAHATKVEICTFDDLGEREVAQFIASARGYVEEIPERLPRHPTRKQFSDCVRFAVPHEVECCHRFPSSSFRTAQRGAQPYAPPRRASEEPAQSPGAEIPK